MGGDPSLASAVLLALVSAREEDEPEPDRSTGNVVVRGTAIGAPSQLRAFLEMNPEERFDIEAVNVIDRHALLREARTDKRLLREAVRTAEALLPRVRAETEDPLLVGAILCDKTMDWYRRSGADPDWAEDAPLRWGGIFYESREPGGRLRRKLSTRLVSLINDFVTASGAVAVFRAGFSGLFRGPANVKSVVQFGLGSKRPRLTQQVAQAYLDDLSANPRNGDQPLPLEHLSEVARRNGSAEVNNTLAELFRPKSTRSLVVLDTRFHPGMKAVTIRVVPSKSSGEASTYDLVQMDGASAGEADAAPDGAPDGGPNSPWEREGMTPKDWLRLLKSLEKGKTRLDPPPHDNPRERESYLGLRALVLSDPAARKALLAVRWRGKPNGLPLLCQLLSQGTWVPDVETDADYLEAELDHLDPERGARRPKDGHWNLEGGWKIVREVRSDNTRVYTARAAPGD